MPAVERADTSEAGAHRSPDALAQHQAHQRTYAAEREAYQGRADRLSWARLILFLSGVAVLSAGLSQSSLPLLALGALLLLGFGVAVLVHLGLLNRRDLAQQREQVHARHIDRLSDRWTEFPSQGAGLLPADHGYAGDVDLVGPGSLFQRLDVTHTRVGEKRLAQWLGEPASETCCRARQQAVRELASKLEFRQELEVAARVAGEDKLDGSGLARFTARPRLFDNRPGLRLVIFALPLLSGVAYLLGQANLGPAWLWLPLVLAQIALLRMNRDHVREGLDLATARHGSVAAFERMLALVEKEELQAPLLRKLQASLQVNGQPPSREIHRLKRWVGWAELRTQFLVHVFANPLLLWDLHVLRGLEAWTREVGPSATTWFDGLGELEALCSLATLAHGDPEATFPEIAQESQSLIIDGLQHPLLPREARVANDVSLPGPRSALLVTGSNMAGKSTLLRSVGLNTALALAGGPVCARRMSLPNLRLRASMRINDSLQAGASYFHAELERLKSVVREAEVGPPVLFLLDELLRGTNAQARHLGARAVLEHLLHRGALGLVATHDVALADLSEDDRYQVSNVHFTDVLQNGQMRFDYRLRPGVVRTSNALRLLAQAGIDIPAQALAREKQASSGGAGDVRPEG